MKPSTYNEHGYMWLENEADHTPNPKDFWKVMLGIFIAVVIFMTASTVAAAIFIRVFGAGGVR